MATTTVFALVALSKALSWNEALSGVFGSISLATWIFLLVGSSPLLAFGKGILILDTGATANPQLHNG